MHLDGPKRAAGSDRVAGLTRKPHVGRGITRIDTFVGTAPTGCALDGCRRRIQRAGDDGALARSAGDTVEERACTAHEGMRRLVQLLPRVMRGMRRRPDETVQLRGVVLGPRHGSVLALVRLGQRSVGSLASEVDLNLATVSGLVADLERAGFVERSPDASDRRRTMVRIVPGNEPSVDLWLEGATAPIMRALNHLDPQEREVFVRAMGLLEAELNRDQSGCGAAHQDC
jgi:DNA-binding MarR family transcriptional regulator